MPEEILPVNQKGYIAPIVPKYIEEQTPSDRTVDPYALIEQRLANIGKAPSTFTNVAATELPGTGRYDKIFPGENMEEFYAQGQTWSSKMVNSLGKGLALTGTTLLQSTVGLANGVYQALGDGRAASFYDNEFNRNLDEFNKTLEDQLPNYYTQKERNADWYSPDKLFSANFFWDGIVKNMGFAAGAALSGGVYAAGLKALGALPGAARLFSIGKAAETLAATEEALVGAGKGAEVYGKVKSLSDKFLGAYKGLDVGQRALVAGLATTGEAGFEAYHNLNDFRNKKIEEYKAANGGVAPTGEELNKINLAADSVGNTSFLLNTALLTATNYIQFPKILGSSTRLEKGIINSTVKEIGDITIDAAGKAAVKSKNIISKIAPYTFSASEAFEEGAQYAIGIGTQDYYNKKYKGDDADFTESLGLAVAETLGTNEGMENVLIGGLSGSLMMGPGKFMQSRQKATDTAAAVQAFNKSQISDFTKETMDSVRRGVAIQEDREQQLKEGNTANAKDLATDYIINYLTPRIKYGRFDLVKSDIEEYRRLASTDEGFAQLQAEGKALAGDTREGYMQRLAGLESTAENVKSLYQSLTLRYGNLVNKEGKPIYNNEVMDKMIYAATKVADYDKRIPQLIAKLSAAGIYNMNILESKEAYDEALQDIDDLPIIEDDQLDMKQDLIDLKDLSDRRSKFLKEYSAIKNAPQSYTTPEVDNTIDTGKKIIVKTKVGDKELEVGVEYYAGAKEIEVEEGGTIQKFSRFKVLGESEDGEQIRVQFPNNRIAIIPKAAIEQYKLGKVSDTEKLENAKFFIETTDHIFTYNLGKGNTKPGRLTYDPKTDKLTFTSLDGKFTRQVTRDQFEAQEGYTVGQIYSNKKFTPKADEARRAAVAKEEKLATRNKIVVDLYNSSKKRLDEVNAILEKNRKRLTGIEEALDNVTKTAAGLPRKRITKAITKTINELSKTRQDIEAQNAQLQAEKEELEATLPYFQDMASNVGELEGTGREVLNQLKSDINALEEMISHTDDAIKQGNSLIESIDSALQTALSLFNDFVRRVKEENPNVATSLADFQDRLEKYMGEEGAKQFIADKLGFTELVMELEDSLSEFEKDLKIPAMEGKLDKLQSQIKELADNLDDLINEQIAKGKVLEAFEQYAENAKKQEEEEKKLIKNRALQQEFLGTNVTYVQNTVDTKAYEQAAKKFWTSVVGGTIPINDGKAHQIRANKFGFLFPKMKNADAIRGLVITANNENEIIPGLTEHLYAKDPGNVIALVMVQMNEDGSYTLVDENGQPIPAGADLVNTAIYQVFPTEKLTATYNGKTESMFRQGTPGEDELRQQYADWRKAQFAKTDLGEPEMIAASFGVPKYVTDSEGNRIYEARTSAEDAGLVTKAELAKQPVITVATTNESVSSDDGSVTFTSPLGRVFLRVGSNGLVRLLNRKLNNKEANLIYDVMHQVTKNALEDGSIKKERSQSLLRWLKSTVYWGIAKNTQTGQRKVPGFNNIWFEDVTEDGQTITKLFMSGKGANFEFTPSGLEANKDAILALLEGMYNNADARMLDEKAFNEPYFEVTGLNEDGTPIFKEWTNYQTYLLSGEGRSSDEIPMATNFVPMPKDGSVNRNDIYFTMTSTPDNYDLPKSKPVVTAAPKTEPAPAPATAEKQTAAPSATDPGVFTLDGTTENTLVLNGGLGFVTFTADIKKYDGKSLPIAYSADEDTMAKLLAKLGTQEKVDQIVTGTILLKIQTQLASTTIPNDATPEELTDEEVAEWDSKPTNPIDDEVYRLQLVKQIKQFQGENWTKLESWLKANLPNIPVYRVKNVIQATNGRQAWGMFRNGAIYIYENAEVGTAYHEVFHAVMSMFTDAGERNAIYDEFKKRKGTFEDADGNTVSYLDATYKQAEEALAEEFKDYVLTGKIPSKPTEGRPFILKMFADLVNFIKEMFLGPKAPSNTEKLFERVGSGYYQSIIPFESNLSYAKEGIIDIEDARDTAGGVFSIAKIPVTQVHEIMEQMTYSTLARLSKTNKSLFSVPTLNKTKLYAELKSELNDLLHNKTSQIANALVRGEITKEEASREKINTIILGKNIEAEWNNIVTKHKEFLKSYSVEFDENDNAILNDEDASGKSDWQDARKMDNFKKANAAIKLLVGTLPVMQVVNGELKPKPSSIGGKILMPSDKVFITLMNALHTSVNIDEMAERLRTLANNDPNYVVLYTRIAKGSPKQGVDFNQLKNDHDLQLISAFWRTFKRQNADVRIVFTLPSGEVVVGDSTLSSAAKQSRSDMSSSIIATLRSPNTYVAYDTTKKEYNSQAGVKNVKLIPGELSTYTSFLNKVGIDFTPKELRKLTPNQLRAFRKATEGLLESLSSIKEVKTLNTKTINADGVLLTLGSIRAVIENPEFESTYFNLNGERTQTYIGTNLVSDMYDTISKVNNFDDLGSTKYSYLTTDVFALGSATMDKMFNLEFEDKDRKANTQDLLKTGYVDGISNEQTNKKKESSKLNYKERVVQEINLNLVGQYLNLVPGDASIEHMINMGIFVSQNTLADSGMTKVYEIFDKYFISELNLAREARDIVQDADETRSTYDLRFFKSMLDPDTHNKIVNMIKAGKTNEEIVKKYGAAAREAVDGFATEQAKESEALLKSYDVILQTEEGIVVEGIEFSEKGKIDQQTLNRELKGLAINYMIANIELHKLVYSDPYQYKDELKRIKNFLSPRQPLLANSEAINVIIDKVYNSDDLGQDKIGRTDFIRDHFRSVVLVDVLSKSDLANYGIFEETDGGGYITMKANRNFRIRAGKWNANEEKQFKYDVAFERLVKSGADTEEIKAFLKKNPKVMSAYTPIKPIVAGNTGEEYNKVVLDKFALVPLSFLVQYQINPNSNAINLYNKMQAEDIDYAVYGTGRKVGAGAKHSIYNNGKFNTEAFQEVTDIPFDIMGEQSEVPSKEAAYVTQGSQITKLVTMDMMEAGMPVDFEPGGTIDERFAKWIALEDKTSYNGGDNLYKQIVDNQKLLEAKIEHGYDVLLKKLGISKVGKKFKITNVDKMIDTLKNEILKREVNDNITAAFEGFKNGDVVLEATPAYQQIRNILYSIADKNVVSPKLNGGLKVQVPVTMLESVKGKVDENGAYVSDTLKFYKNADGERVCEIMIGRWFNSSMTDEELMTFFNSEEGQEILKGVGYRIPTQKQNSIDVFKVAKILPKEFGDSVIIPSELVKKVGSDFDIDKLSIYLKNVLVNSKGEPKLIPFFGIGEEAKEKLSKWAIDNELETFAVAKKNLLKTTGGETLEDMEEDDFEDRDLEDDLYARSLENAYLKSLENLISSPENFEALTKPNSADQLKGLSNEITEKLGNEKVNYSSTGNMLSRTRMSQLRHDFVTGKYAIGIAATGQTNHAQNQRSLIYIDTDRIKNGVVLDEDKFWLDDGAINLPHNKMMVNGKNRPTLSLINTQPNEDFPNGQPISDVIGQFIDGYVDISKDSWIMRMGATPNTAGTWLFLLKLGVPARTVAYFMNQPIVRDYLRQIESAGYSWLFIGQIMDDVLDTYKQGDVVAKFNLPTEDSLGKMVGKSIDKMTPVQLAQQRFVLTEFLKYAKMANQLFQVTQGSNYDTATINDPYLLFKKQMQLQKARRTIISSVDDILNSSFIGVLKETMGDIRDAFAEILVSDKPSVRRVIEATLTPFVELNDKDFVKVSRKAVNDLFDWAVQTNTKVNNAVTKILLGDDTSVSAATEIMDFKNMVMTNPKYKDSPLRNNLILNSIQRFKPVGKENTPDNLQLIAKDAKVYNQNQIIYAFRELKKEAPAGLYGKLVRLAVLQSGLNNSPISFTSLLPYEDFKTVYNETLAVIQEMPNLADFNKLNVFQRNNWADTNIVPSKKAEWRKSAKTKKWYSKPFAPSEMTFVDKRLKLAMQKKTIPQVINISPLSREAKSKFITFVWEDKNLSAQQKAEYRKRADFSYIKKGLFQRVEDGFGNPLVTTSTGKDETVYESYVYKAINAWGDSFRANEFYTDKIQSKIDNGYIKVNEVEDDDISSLVTPEVKEAKSEEDPFTC